MMAGPPLAASVVCAPGLSERRTRSPGDANRRPHSGQFCGWRHVPWLRPGADLQVRFWREIVLVRMRRARNPRSCHDLAVKQRIAGIALALAVVAGCGDLVPTPT